MATRKSTMIGPFSRGLNTYDDPTALHDQELVEALNFDPGLDGSMRNRPPFTNTGDSFPVSGSGVPHLLGFFYDVGDVAILIASDGVSSTYRYDVTAADPQWVLITDTMSASAMTQYDGKAWLLSPVGETDPGGYWTSAGGFVADADMPHGTSITSYKSRLWVAQGVGGSNPTRVLYSKVLGQPDFWKNAAFTDIGSGDGQFVVKIVTYYDVMLVFRTGSIWSYQYSSDPATAIQSVVVPGVGLQNAYCLVAYENYLYFLYDENAYAFINNRATQINVKVPFTSSAKESGSSTFAVSLFSNRILYSYYENIYSYSIRTQTWTKWRSDAYGPISQVLMPLIDEQTGVGYALPVPTGSSLSLLRIEDALTDAAENMLCVLTTKNYNFDAPGSFKVLFWWGVDVIFKHEIQGVVIPGVFNLSATWGDLARNMTWGKVRLNTWRFPYLSDRSVVSDVSTGTGPMRKFVKFFKKLRFRQLQFRVSFRTDGSKESAPVQVFTISTYMTEKQTVSKTIS